MAFATTHSILLRGRRNYRWHLGQTFFVFHIEVAPARSDVEGRGSRDPILSTGGVLGPMHVRGCETANRNLGLIDAVLLQQSSW